MQSLWWLCASSSPTIWNGGIGGSWERALFKYTDPKCADSARKRGDDATTGRPIKTGQRSFLKSIDPIQHEILKISLIFLENFQRVARTTNSHTNRVPPLVSLTKHMEGEIF